MDPCRRQELDAQLIPRRDAAHLVIEAPTPEKRLCLVDLIPLNRPRRHVENATLGQGSPQLDVLPMSPDEGHGAVGGIIVKEFALGNIRLVPA